MHREVVGQGEVVKMSKTAGLEAGGIGRKNFPQLFLISYNFSDRFGTTSFGNVHFGDLTRVPNIGHILIASLELSIFLPPGIVPSLCV